jgi:hypothetical protein
MKKQFAFLVLIAWTCHFSFGQQQYDPVTNLSAQEDHARLMKLLGITEVRHGKSGDPSHPNTANYEESVANPCPELPKILVTEKGKKVTTPEIWWKTRRPQIVDLFEREVYGKIPDNVPKVDWKIEVAENEFVGRIPVIARKLTGHADNSAYPLLDVNIDMMLVIPTNVKGPVPVLIMYGSTEFPSPNQPTAEDLEKINKSFKSMMIANDPEMKTVFDRYPVYKPITKLAGPNFCAPPVDGNSPRNEQLLAAGWGYAMLSTASIQADNGNELTKGIIGLTNKGKPRTPEQWGALRAWAWGASRVLDYLESEPLVDSKKVGIEGVSRYGKAALVALAFDTRFAVGLIGSSGKGGTTLHRRIYGETVENLAGSGSHHWMAGNYIKYAAEKGKLGKMTGCDLPVDSHQLIALAAPRLAFISYGIPESGDAHWLDQKGSYKAVIAAGEAYKLLNSADLGLSNDYNKEAMPPMQTDLLDGNLAWRQHEGGHTDAPNFQYFIPWASKKLGYEKP